MCFDNKIKYIELPVAFDGLVMVNFKTPGRAA
jgi:hypothetical protein